MEENYNKLTRPFCTLLRMISWKGILVDRKVVGREYKMKHNSKQFLALFMAVSMAVAPVSGVYAEDQNAAVGDTLSENKQVLNGKHVRMAVIMELLGVSADEH